MAAPKTRRRTASVIIDPDKRAAAAERRRRQAERELKRAASAGTGARATSSRRPAKARKGKAPSKRGTMKETAGLPGWGDLAPGTAVAKQQPQAEVRTPSVPTLTFALLIVLITGGFTLYVGHVHATQALLAEVQQARRDNLRLHLKYNRLKGAFDEATGPAVIYERARALGLEEGFTYGPTIPVTPLPKAGSGGAEKP